MRLLTRILILIAFLANSFVIVQADELVLPKPGVMVGLSESFKPVVMRGIKIDPANPFRFNFLVDEGDTHLNEQGFKDEAQKVIKFFLTSLTIPDNDLWVNLSPYEKNRIIPQAFGQTEMGRDLLAQDYILKQITASLIYPENEIGKKFWEKVYKLAQEKYGSTNIPINTFNKVWIMPDHATVYQHQGTAFVISYHLKVMLEQDYLALDKNKIDQPDKKEVSSLSSQVVRSIVLPELEKEVNSGKNFASLRQVFYSLILATWYKTKVKQAILNQVYADKDKVAGVLVDDQQDKEKIYQQYLQAFKKGVFNYIKEDLNLNATNETIPRKYFSGGVLGHIDPAVIAYVPQVQSGGLYGIRLRNVSGEVGLINRKKVMPDHAMITIPSTVKDFYEIAERIQGSPIIELANFVVASRQGIIDISNNYEQLLSELDGEINSQFLNTFKEKMEIFKNKIMAVPIKEGSEFVPGDEEFAQQTISAYKKAITTFRETLEETSIFQGALAGLRISHDKLADLKVQRVLDGVSINRRNLYRLVEHFTLITTGNAWGIVSPSLDLNKLLEDAVERERNYIPYQMRAVRVSFELDGAVPKIVGDKARLMTGFREVIRNAIFATVRHVERGIYTPLRDRSNVLIRTKYMPQENLIQVSIVDNGIGMDAEKLRNMSFYGISMSDWNKGVMFGGHGIGFSVMLSTILEHGGKVQVESDLENGTTITASIPEETIHAPHIDRESIRVVKDNSQLSNTGGIDLTSKRYKISIESDGQELKMDFDPAMVRDLQFDGVEFRINRIDSVINPQRFLLGFSDN